MPKTFDERLSAIRTDLDMTIPRLPDPFPGFVLFFSVSDGDSRARVTHASAASFEEAWVAGTAALKLAMDSDGIAGDWLRVDWVDGARVTTWQELRATLMQTKRNYFRYGIATGVSFETSFTEQELNANAMLYGGNTYVHAILNEKNFGIYAAQRFPDRELPALDDAGEAIVFSTRGVFCDETGVMHSLNPIGLDTGRRTIADLDEAALTGIIHSSSSYLAEQVQADGRFVYGYHPCFDRRIDTYNALRHASTTYSMIEAWEVTRDPNLKSAIDRSVKYLTEKLIQEATLADGTVVAFLVDEGREIKLGGCAVSILALAKNMQASGDRRHLDLMGKLALGIRQMQDEETGAFVHVLNFPDLTVKQHFRTIYYEGEAAFGLMRLYELTKDYRWLSMVEDAFEHFIAQDHWRHHDHWLGYCANELTRHCPDERYFRFGLRNVADYLDFVENRITTFPTLLELMMAARETLSRIGADRRLHRLLAKFDLMHFDRALEARANYLLNGYFWPEMAMYFRKPERIAGSFFIRHHAFRVRIDDVEHYLSGLVAYRRYLAERESFREMISRFSKPAAIAKAPDTGWTAENVARATGGTWLRSPSDGWSASGLATYLPAAREGDMVLMRSGVEKIGVLRQVLPRLPKPAAVILSDPAQMPDGDLPILHVPDSNQAVLGLGRHARDHMSGKLTGITGSAGKTTMVAMVAHALEPFGGVAKTRQNANLPIGVAWNLASMPWDTPNAVMELAIGRMAVSARMAKPDVAIFTNVLPAHLGERSTVADIARTKSAIFLGMQPGSTAVLYNEMLERDLVADAARARNLKIVWYGEGANCDLRLDGYNSATGEVKASVDGRSTNYRVGAPGRHMALNSLAALATVIALGHPLEPAIQSLSTFTALPGRGEQLELTIDGRHLTIIDDAYNANPGSMLAALDRLSEQKATGRRIAVLGQMAELGPDAAGYHTALAALVSDRQIDRVYVTGELYDGFWKELSPGRRGIHAPSLDILRDNLLSELEDGDTVLLKGSNSTRMHELVGYMKRRSAA